MLEDMAVATGFLRVEVSSGKCDVHFQTAVLSVGFEVDAIEHERSWLFKRVNINSQRMQMDHAISSFHTTTTTIAKASKCG